MIPNVYSEEKQHPASVSISSCIREPKKRDGDTTGDWHPRASWAVLLHSILWTGLVVALVVFSIPNLWRETRRDRFGPIDSLHSIDRYLWGMNGAKIAHQVVETFAHLPEDRRVVILARADGESSLLAVGMSYLAWPRRVQMFSGDDRALAQQLGAISPDSVGAVVFCKIHPPGWFPAGVACGPDVRIVCFRESERRP